MTDEELMLAYIDDDMAAFEVLYERHKKRVFGFLMARLKDHGEAEDVFQAVFAKLHRKRHQYRQDIPFLPWLFTLVRNTLIDHVRKRDVYEKHVVVSAKTVETYAAPVPDETSIHVAVAELSRLNESQRRALELRFNQGLSFAEIAEQMQTSADNSRQIISRAIRKLRTLMVKKEKHHEKN
ncbi:MAG: RNA polymerase sigma factor [Desulfuromonadales bacterium]|nr:RNA polymerase sigma factor [Desulfuromonadales bacterium]